LLDTLGLQANPGAAAVTATKHRDHPQGYVPASSFIICFLSQEPDALMEPGILRLVGKYVQLGGQPVHLIKDLSDNYMGKRTATDHVTASNQTDSDYVLEQQQVGWCCWMWRQHLPRLSSSKQMSKAVLSNG
jgi:hypothetical protein